MTTSIQSGPEKFRDIFAKKKSIRPPAYRWQDLALRVIEELRVPLKKRNAIFKVCRNHSQATIEKCLNDTKELCQEGECWRYFFKLIANKRQTRTPHKKTPPQGRAL